MLSGLGRLGLTPKQTSSLITLDLGSKQQTYGVDIRFLIIYNTIMATKLYPKIYISRPTQLRIWDPVKICVKSARGSRVIIKHTNRKKTEITILYIHRYTLMLVFVLEILQYTELCLFLCKWICSTLDMVFLYEGFCSTQDNFCFYIRDSAEDWIMFVLC